MYYYTAQIWIKGVCAFFSFWDNVQFAFTISVTPRVDHSKSDLSEYFLDEIYFHSAYVILQFNDPFSQENNFNSKKGSSRSLKTVHTSFIQILCNIHPFELNMQYKMFDFLPTLFYWAYFCQNSSNLPNSFFFVLGTY